MSPHLHSSTTTPAKARHYTEAVTEALLKGDWGGSGVVKGVKGDALDWTEGARKWEKHTGGGEFKIGTVKGSEEAHLLRRERLWLSKKALQAVPLRSVKGWGKLSDRCLSRDAEAVARRRTLLVNVSSIHASVGDEDYAPSHLLGGEGCLSLPHRDPSSESALNGLLVLEVTKSCHWHCVSAFRPSNACDIGRVFLWIRYPNVHALSFARMRLHILTSYPSGATHPPSTRNLTHVSATRIFSSHRSPDDPSTPLTTSHASAFPFAGKIVITTREAHARGSGASC